ncbi:unnamed protein product [Citrullus colocynthis]|uniref:Uncharacterized protein n=1 Tax=Citrullus colocynthis TaxID=252529 RepID=A0ABP0YQL4_9ROSI
MMGPAHVPCVTPNLISKAYERQHPIISHLLLPSNLSFTVPPPPPSIYTQHSRAPQTQIPHFLFQPSYSSFVPFQWRWLSSLLSCSSPSLLFPCFRPLSWPAVVVETGTHMDQGASNPSNAQIDVPLDAEKHSTTSHACSSAKSAAGSACVCRLATMETKPFALATTTGRQRKEDPNALKKNPNSFSC